MKRPETQQTVTVTAQEVHTGNQDFDRSRFRSKGFNDKPEKTAQGSPIAAIGDVVDATGQFFISHDFAMMLGYAAAGYCFYKSTIGWSILAGTPIVGVCFAAIEQFLELLPRMGLYFPEIADRLTFKLALSKFVDPKIAPNHPTLLEETKEWARDADRKAQRLMEAVSWLCYIGAFFAACLAFKIWNARAMTVDPTALFNVVLAVGGFEIAIIFVRWMRRNRLTFRESRKYRELKRRERLAAEQALMAGK